jgi:hypothetical protein
VTETPITAGVETTVIFIQKQTLDGQDMFIRGGISHEQRPGIHVFKGESFESFRQIIFLRTVKTKI